MDQQDKPQQPQDDYRPPSQSSYDRPATPQQEGGGDYRPNYPSQPPPPPPPPQPPQYGSAEHHPPQPQYQQPPQSPQYPPQTQYQQQPYYAHSATVTTTKKGLPLLAWLLPLIIILAAGGGLGAWALLSNQNKSATDGQQAQATSTPGTQGQLPTTPPGRPTPASRNTPTTGVQGNSGNADLLKSAVANMKATKSYHLVVDANMGGQDIQMDGDIDVANKKIKLNVSAQGQNVSVITIGSDAYVSADGGQNWTKKPSSIMNLDSFTKLWDNFKSADIDKARAALKDGDPSEEKVGDDDTRHMTASSKDLSSLSTGGGEGTVDFWVTTGNKPTVRKMKAVGKSQGQDLDATIEWSNVDEPVTIEAPENVTTP